MGRSYGIFPNFNKLLTSSCKREYDYIGGVVRYIKRVQSSNMELKMKTTKYVVVVAVVFLFLPFAALATDSTGVAPDISIDAKKNTGPDPTPLVPAQDQITTGKAYDFLSQAAALRLEEMPDNRLETMVCTPHALPRKLFFQALCPCTTDPDSKISTLEILALSEEMVRSGEGDEDVSLTMRDIDQDITSSDYLFQVKFSEVNTCVYPALNQGAPASEALSDDFGTRVLRSRMASF